MRKILTEAYRYLAVILAAAFIFTGCRAWNNRAYKEENGNPGYEEENPYEAASIETGATKAETAETKPEEAETSEAEPEETASAEADIRSLDIDGVYTSKEDVSLYIHSYGTLPSNFITKNEARILGWEGGSLDEFAEGKCIGGDRFGNYEKLLPEKKGRKYRECDINTLHKKKRGAERLVFSNDGLIFYTPDHYETWEQLY